MYKKTVKYVDFNGDEREEDFYFNFTKQQLLQMRGSKEGGLEAYIDRIMRANDNNQVLEAYREILLLAYGEKSEDGRRHIKNDEIRENFESHAAFSDIYMEIFTNVDAATALIRGVMPADLMSQVEEQGKLEEQIKNASSRA